MSDQDADLRAALLAQLQAAVAQRLLPRPAQAIPSAVAGPWATDPEDADVRARAKGLAVMNAYTGRAHPAGSK